MARYTGMMQKSDNMSREIFDNNSNGAQGRDNSVDLPGKLTSFFKRGLGRKYTVDPQRLDAPIKQKHTQYMNDQLAKVSYDKYIKAMAVDIDRRKSYMDFTNMEYTPEISSALDIFGDESTVQNGEEKILTITSDNPKIKAILENLFDDILDIDHNLWHWIRSMCKYGDHFGLLDIKEGSGITGLLDLPVDEIRREEAYDGLNSVKFVWDQYDTQFAAWQVAHFRLTNDQKRLPYGTSSLESARLIWKQLSLAEDAMNIYRIARAPERRVFYVDVGNIDPADVGEYIQNIKNSVKRTPQVSQTTGNIEQRYNTMAIDEDYFIPRRNEKNSEVNTLPGASNLDDIADIEYMQKKLFAALKVPKAFLTYDEDIDAQSGLSNQDARFARTINRIQQAATVTLTQMAVIHLFALGLRDKDQLMGFNLELTNPSTQNELEKIEILSKKASVFSDLWDEGSLSPISWTWGMKNIFGFSEGEMKLILRQQFLEGKMKLDIETASTPPEPGMDAEGGMDVNKFPDGSEAPETPPAGYEYVDAETHEAISEELGELYQKTKSFITESRIADNKMIIQDKFNPANPINYLDDFAIALEEGIKLNLNKRS